MPFTSSILPSDIHDGGWLTRSGLYELTVTSARHPQATYCPDGRIWDRIVMSGHVPAWPGCSVWYRVAFEVELPQLDRCGRVVSSAPHCEALCFFMGLRDRLGRLSLPDPAEVTLSGRHGAYPRTRSYEHWPQLERSAAGRRRRVHILIDCLPGTAEAGGVPLHHLVGFCDCRGRSARDVAEDRDINELHRSFMQRCDGSVAELAAAGWFPTAPRPVSGCAWRSDALPQSLASMHD